MNILEVQNLCKIYGSGEAEVRALNQVSFSVRRGEFIAIVGESGSGKSTLLKSVGALDNPTSGKVWIDGKDVFSMSEKKLTVFRRQHIGFIFQSFNLIPKLNAEQNLTFPLLLDYKTPDQKFVDELLYVLGLTERRNHLPSQLSGGRPGHSAGPDYSRRTDRQPGQQKQPGSNCAPAIHVGKVSADDPDDHAQRKSGGRRRPCFPYGGYSAPYAKKLFH